MITGTDTGVGKTVTTAAIAAALAAGGRAVGVFKPVETGVGPAERGDADFVLAVLASRQSVVSACPYRFAAPAAPLVSAAAEGAVIDPERIRAGFLALRDRYDTVLVEGAGGLLVPIGPRFNMADLALLLGLPLVVVARPGLGTINHTLLTLEAARSRGIEVLGVVLCGWRAADDLATLTNPGLLAHLGRVPLLGVLPWDSDLRTDASRPGNLRAWAAESLSPALGGRFDAEAFVAAHGLPRVLAPTATAADFLGPAAPC
jgi:dethiobiotin synthetase